MPRVSAFTGRRTTVGHMYTRRGKAKYLGGVGTKVTGKTKRKFRPNIHTVTAMVDGSMQRIKISAKAIRNGKLVRPLKRKFTYKAAQAAAAASAAGSEQSAGQPPTV